MVLIYWESSIEYRNVHNAPRKFVPKLLAWSHTLPWPKARVNEAQILFSNKIVGTTVDLPCQSTIATAGHCTPSHFKVGLAEVPKILSWHE